jgi:hypothetical protein
MKDKIEVIVCDNIDQLEFLKEKTKCHFRIKELRVDLTDDNIKKYGFEIELNDCGVLYHYNQVKKGEYVIILFNDWLYKVNKNHKDNPINTSKNVKYLISFFKKLGIK